MNTKRVLLTGATGFIGRHCLAPLLADGCEVHAVSSRTPGETAPAVHWHRADLLDSTQADALMARIEPTHLLHLAWFAVPGLFWTSPENVAWVKASLGLLQAFARRGGRRVVMAGTCAEYDWDYGLCSERFTPLRPTTLYGSCKHALQTVLEGSARTTGLSAAWGRVFFAYGPHEHRARLVPSVIGPLLRGEPALCSHGGQVRDFLYVQDVADALAALLGSGVSGPVNIASGRPVRLQEVIAKIAEKTDGQHLVRLGALPAPPDEPPVLLADVRRLTEELGWLPRFDLDAGLDESLEWWRGVARGEGARASSGRTQEP